MESPSSPQPVAQSAHAQGGAGVLELFVRGFTAAERELLDAIVQLSHRRSPKILLVSASNADKASIVMVDGKDADARAWADNQPWLKDKAVIWVDAPDAPGRTVVKRPVHWSALPALLARVLEQQTPASALRPESPRPGNNAVLVVDDSFAVRAQLRGLLQSRGLAVTEVENAEAGIKAAAAAPFACILMDVLLPGMDGYEACRRIKANASGGASQIVVMLTSKSSPFDRIRGKMAGCDAYLTKPVEDEHLYEVISRYVTGPAQGGALQQQAPPARAA